MTIWECEFRLADNCQHYMDEAPDVIDIESVGIVDTGWQKKWYWNKDWQAICPHCKEMLEAQFDARRK